MEKIDRKGDDIMGKLNNSEISGVSGGDLSIQKNNNGGYDIISTHIVKTCKDESEAKKMIDEFAEHGAHAHMMSHNRDGGVHVCPGKFECKHHRPK